MGVSSDAFSFLNVMEYLNLGEKWGLTKGAGTQIAIIDTGIDTEGFYGCVAIKEVILPSSISSLGDFVFTHNTSLETLIFEDGIKLEILSGWAFNNCPKLKTIVLPEGLKEIGDSCFMVTGLENIYAGTAMITVNGIGNYTDTVEQAFTIDPKPISEYEVTEDGNSVEYSQPISNKSESIKIPDTVKLDGITYKVTLIKADAFKNNKSLKKVSIGKNVESIGNEAFSGCMKLKSISLGSKLKTIGSKAFYKCTSPTSYKSILRSRGIGKKAVFKK